MWLDLETSGNLLFLKLLIIPNPDLSANLTFSHVSIFLEPTIMDYPFGTNDGSWGFIIAESIGKRWSSSSRHGGSFPRMWSQCATAGPTCPAPSSVPSSNYLATTTRTLCCVNNWLTKLLPQLHPSFQLHLLHTSNMCHLIHQCLHLSSPLISNIHLHLHLRQLPLILQRWWPVYKRASSRRSTRRWRAVVNFTVPDPNLALPSQLLHHSHNNFQLSQPTPLHPYHLPSQHPPIILLCHIGHPRSQVLPRDVLSTSKKIDKRSLS